MVLAEIVAAAAMAAKQGAGAVAKGASAAAAGTAKAAGAAATGAAKAATSAPTFTDPLGLMSKSMPRSTPLDAPRRVSGPVRGADAGKTAAAGDAPEMTGTPLQRFSARFVSGFSEGLKAESERRAKAGRSGGGLGKAFAEGVQPVNDFTALINQEALAGMKALAFKSLGATLSNERAANNKLASDAASNQVEIEEVRDVFDAENE